MSLKKISFIVTEVSGVTFYRCWQPAMEMRKMGVKSALLWYNHKQFERPDWEWQLDNPEFGGKIRRDLDMACEWGDVVVWMALHTPSSIQFYQEMRLKYSGKPFFLELDDILFDIPAYNAGSIAYYPGSPLADIILQQIRNCDGLIVSTPYLKERMGKYHRNIHVVENVVDSSLWRMTSPRRHRVNIGWMGGATHEEDLRLMRDVVPEVLARHKNVQFTFAHGCPEFFKHRADCEWLDTNDPRYHRGVICTRCGGMDRVNWNHIFQPIMKPSLPKRKDYATREDLMEARKEHKKYVGYPAWMSRQKFDIGIAPLVDNTFNRAKSNLRWLEYSAMGIPTVASPVMHFKQTIEHGRTGLFAETTEDWVENLGRLINENMLRESIGGNALDEVKKNWNPRVAARKYIEAIEGMNNAIVNPEHISNPDRGPDRRSEQHAVLSV